jgi:hypothetical protein
MTHILQMLGKLAHTVLEVPSRNTSGGFILYTTYDIRPRYLNYDGLQRCRKTLTFSSGLAALMRLKIRLTSSSY